MVCTSISKEATISFSLLLLSGCNSDNNVATCNCWSVQTYKRNLIDGSINFTSARRHRVRAGVTPSLGARTGGVTPFGESLYPLTPVQRFVQGRDVFVSLPTGSEKSLCYWLLPSVVEHLRGISCCTVIFVSPLDAEIPRHAELLLFAPLS